MSPRHLAFVSARLGAAAVFLLTWAYGATALSPFAFDMFVKPRLFTWLETFVAWHHLFFLAAGVASSATLIPLLAAGRRQPSARLRVAWWAAVAYVVVIGAAALSLLAAPRLALATSGRQDLMVVPGALVPLIWLAVIDHLVAWPLLRHPAGEETAQRRLVVTALAAASLLWLAHQLRITVVASSDGGTLAGALGGAWALALTAAAFGAAALVLMLIAAVAAGTRSPRAWEYALAVILAAVAVAAFVRRVVLPPLLFGDAAATAAAVSLGGAVVLMVAGLRLRTTPPDRGGDTGLDLLLAYRGRPVMRAVLMAAVPAAAAITLGVVERIDWAMILSRVVVLVEALIVSSLVLAATRGLQRPAWSLGWLLGPAVVVLVAVHALPLTARAAIAASGDGAADPQRLLDRYRVTDPLTSLAAAALVAQREADPLFYRELVDAEARLSRLEPRPTGATFAALDTDPPRRPHVFLFVVDSLRRDYLSPYNPEVTFTPAIDAWARESLVFKNAFTQYGGTWLSIPAIWTGSEVTRQWGSVFAKLNALEPLIASAGYDLVVNDYTVAELLRPETTRTFLDPSIPSVDTDLCQNLTSLKAHLDRTEPPSPTFAYLAPMNVHILNTRTGAAIEDDAVPGFYAPYASRLQRLDGCFGGFIEYLKARGLYDDSVIILTSDHGDSLGDEGRWGHQFYLFPEDLRVPLIIRLPDRIRPAVTADLGRLTFLTDLTPSLYALLGHTVRDLGPGFGQPLFVPPDEEPSSRRRDTHLVMSSYGSSYGLLRRNGRTLYIVDLVNRREDAFALFREPLGERRPVSDALRRLGQAAILDGLGRVERLFGPS